MEMNSSSIMPVLRLKVFLVAWPKRTAMRKTSKMPQRMNSFLGAKVRSSGLAS
jgi:hypothetical protein